MTCRSVAEAAVKAGYSAKNARQSGHQALKAIRGRVPDLMERLGLSEEHLIDKHLRRHLKAKKTVFYRFDMVRVDDGLIQEHWDVAFPNGIGK